VTRKGHDRPGLGAKIVGEGKVILKQPGGVPSLISRQKEKQRGRTKKKVFFPVNNGSTLR